MLVLTRRMGQAIRIGNDVEIHVMRVDGDRIQLGILAPRSVPIVRSELVDAVGAETRTAAAARELVRAALRERTGTPSA